MQILDGQVAHYRFGSTPAASGLETNARDIVLGEKERGKAGIKDRLKIWVRTAPWLRKGGLFIPKVAFRMSGQEDILQGFNYLIMSNRPAIMYVENAAALFNYNLTSLYHPFPRATIRFALRRRNTCLVAMSQRCYRGLMTIFPWLDSSRVFHIYPILPRNPFPPAFAAARSRGENARFLFIGSQFHLKGGKELVRAFAQVCEKSVDVRLTLVTSEADVGPEWMAEIRANKNITMHEPKYDLMTLFEQFYTQNNVLVHPTKFDSFALVILEAMHCGMAVIASRIGAISEMVKDRENGYLYEGCQDIFDAQGLPDAEHWYESWAQTVAGIYDFKLEEFLVRSMLSLAESQDMRKEMGVRSLEMASNPPFAYEYIANQWRDVYATVLSETAV